MNSAPPEPELPDRVPEKRDAVTPDLPPFGPAAPDLPVRSETGESETGDSETDTGETGERPDAGPGNAKPQEPTD